MTIEVRANGESWIMGPSGTETVTLTQTGARERTEGTVILPRNLGPIRLVRELGRGGMGVVYLGWHHFLHRDVAVKFLLSVVANSDDPKSKRFLEEARIAAAVHHPALTAIYHADVVQNIPYLVLQFIDGTSLAAVLKRLGALGVTDAMAVLSTVTEALSALHRRGIVHGDVKPANVMLAHEGQVYVTDYGLACTPMLGPGTGQRGTPAYMAPEMFAGRISPRTDVYACGIMLFELLTGRVPFIGTVNKVRDQHAKQELPFELLDTRQIHPAVVELIELATRKDPVFRYKNAERLRRALLDRVSSRERLREGQAVVQALSRCQPETQPAERAAKETTPAVGSSYYERLPKIKNRIRSGHIVTAPSGMRPLAVESTETGARTILQLRGCPMCGYDLRGLQRRHRCPECGFTYDETMFMVCGWPRSSDRPNLWGALVPGGAFLGFLVYVIIRHGYQLLMSVPVVYWIILLASIPWAIVSWVRRRDVRQQRGGTVQLLFSSLGASQRKGSGQPNFIPWTEFSRLLFWRVGKNLWCLVLDVGRWRTFWRGKYVRAVIECSRREAALLRSELRKRLRAAYTQPSP